MENFRTEFEIEPLPQKIPYPGKILAIGSCFAENLSNKLSYYKFHQLLNPTGIIFNPLSCAETLEFALDLKDWNNGRLYQQENLWVSLSHHGSFSHTDKSQVEQNIHACLKNGKAFAKNMQTLVITWGTAWVYRWKETGEIVANCHKIPSNHFSKELLSIESIVDRYENLFSHLHSSHPDCRVILTVSPIRHWKDGVIQNQESKATLRLAIRELQQRFPNLYYFPSYELMMDDLRDYRFYDADMLHPNSTALTYIWERFKQACIDPNTYQLMTRIGKIQQAVIHKPLQPNGANYKNHVKRTLNLMEALEKEEVWLNFEAERKGLVRWLNSRQSTD